MNFIDEFIARGFLHQATDIDKLTKLIQNGGKVVAYIGFDCTAKSLHVGSLIQIMILRLLQKHAHKPIIVVGGGTTKIGDPSGKEESRQLLSHNRLRTNMEGIRDVIAKFVTIGNQPNDAIMVDNDEWLSSLSYIDFLREYGRHFSVNRMLSFDSVKLRLEREQNLSFLEFNYMLLQAYDFVELNRRYGCVLQIGGSDQWGNIVNGIELNRRLGNKNELFGLTTPLITTASGTKMGKTANGAIWLSHDMLPVYDYYQFWRNTEDSDVIKFMKLFTDLELTVIAEYKKLVGSQINEAKKILAFEATKTCYGEEQAKDAEDAAVKMFEQGQLSDNLPSFSLNRHILEQGIPAYLLFTKSKICNSGGDAKRLIKGNGAKINDELVKHPMQMIDNSMSKNGVIKLSSGKKKHMIIKVK